MSALDILKKSGLTVEVRGDGQTHLVGLQSIPAAQRESVILFAQHHKDEILTALRLDPARDMHKEEIVDPGRAEAIEEWCDRQLNGVISDLNRRGVKFTDLGPSVRRQADWLSDAMTAAANQGDRAGFEKALQEWRTVLMGRR